MIYQVLAKTLGLSFPICIFGVLTGILYLVWKMSDEPSPLLNFTEPFKVVMAPSYFAR